MIDTRYSMPTLGADKVTDITPEILHKMGVSSIILDVDNTLSAPGKQTPYPGTIEWVQRMLKNNFQIIILSNNFKRRVSPFAAKYYLDSLSLGCKPLPFSYFAAMRRLHSSRHNTVVIGDQVFTDIVGANLAGLRSILLTPQTPESKRSFVYRRSKENRVREYLRKNGLYISSKE